MGAFFGFIMFLGIGALVIVATSVRIVQQSTVGVVERLGQFAGVRQAGLALLIPFIDNIRTVDMREQVFSLPPQPVITKDNVTMNIDAVIYFQITDPFKATYEVSDTILAVEKLALTNMRNIIGDMSLDETLSSRDTINGKLQHVLDDSTGKWGIKVNRVELKDINPPRDIEEAMQKQMRAEREKRAQILFAEGEKTAAILKAEGQKTSQILEAEGDKEAAIRRAQGQAEAIREVKQAEADMIYTVFTSIDKANPSKEVLQVKYLEALEKVSQGQSNTLFLPYESIAFLGALGGSVRSIQSQQEKRAE
ncbi:MAG: SPFH domain-containing protein [Vampirovibrionales bacterium]|nr:SPFH domain-containing protein [Vampirovibrionales bacterium]